jgi:hypothetical protein
MKNKEGIKRGEYLVMSNVHKKWLVSDINGGNTWDWV